MIAWTWRGWSRKLRNSNWFSLAMHSSATTSKCSWRSSFCSSRGSGDGCTGWKSVFLVNLVCLVLEKNYSTKSLWGFDGYIYGHSRQETEIQTLSLASLSWVFCRRLKWPTNIATCTNFLNQNCTWQSVLKIYNMLLRGKKEITFIRSKMWSSNLSIGLVVSHVWSDLVV